MSYRVVIAPKCVELQDHVYHPAFDPDTVLVLLIGDELSFTHPMIE